MCYLHYFCLLAHSGVQHILCCVLVLFFFVFVCPMFPVSLHCPLLTSPTMFSNVYLTIKTSASPEACIVEHPYANNF